MRGSHPVSGPKGRGLQVRGPQGTKVTKHGERKSGGTEPGVPLLRATSCGGFYVRGPKVQGP
jgi:hypothetical protein